MVILGEWKGQHLALSDKVNCLTVSLEKDGKARVYSFDYAGRLWTAFIDEISYRRGLDGKIVAKWQPVGGDRDRRWLTREEAVQIEEQARQLAADLAHDLRKPGTAIDQPPSDRILSGLGRAALYDRTRSSDDLVQYRQVYQPVGILPPDQYMAVVLQMTEGCSFNTCTFCSFYRDRRFKIKTPAIFRTHISQVLGFLGDGLSLRRTIFLGDANALVTPMLRLRPLIDVIHEQMDVEAMGGLYAFLDGFSGEKKSIQDYADLGKQGLKRIYIGMESGNAGLLQFLKKPGCPEDVVHAVRSMKRGGVPVGVIALLGAGGREYADGHVRDTIAAINRMGLDADDLIYFSELIEDEGLEYTQDAYQANLHPLSSSERITQGEQIQDGLRFSPSAGIPHISRYDIREFVY
jgi:radical SAM superfamily enzyme YgiQ (UPF0313 family)